MEFCILYTLSLSLEALKDSKYLLLRTNYLSLELSNKVTRFPVICKVEIAIIRKS